MIIISILYFLLKLINKGKSSEIIKRAALAPYLLYDNLEYQHFSAGAIFILPSY